MAAEKKYLCGIDVGTTGTKTIIFDLEGNVAGKGYREYACTYPRPGWVEQDMDHVYSEAMASCREAVTQAAVPPEEIAAVALSTQRTTAVFLDGQEKILKAISWQDTRTVAELEDLEKYIGEKEFYELTGLPFNTTWIITRILWMKKNEPSTWEQVKKIAQVQDYFLRNMGAEDYFIDYPDACLYGLFDHRAYKWDDRLLNIAGIEEKLLPNPTPCGTAVGRLSKEAAALTGLAEGTSICVGAGDQNSASIGAGIVDKGTVSVSLGTGGMAIACLDYPYRDPLSSACVTCHAITGHYQFEGYQLGAASIFRWFRDELAEYEKNHAKEEGIRVYDFLNREIEQVPVGAKGLVLMPYFASSGAPRWDSNARGAILGLTLAHDRPCIARACMEGIALEQKDILTNMQENAITIDSVRIIGGATNSNVWNQIQADMYKLPCDTLAVEDAAVLGAAIMAGKAVGIFADIPEGVRKMVHVKEHYEPIRAHAEIYDKMYDIYCSAYEGLAGSHVYEKLAELQNMY